MKKLLIAALFAPLVALAQTYPSPTFNSITLQNPLTAANGGTGATSSTGTGSTVLSNSPTLTTPNLGTPSAVTLTNGTGLPISTGVSGLGTGVAAGLANAVTGSGSPVLATSPSIASPTITGTFTATGLVTTADLATQAANTVLANVTGSTASPTAYAMPSCSGSANAISWTSGSGFTCNTSLITASQVSSTYAPIASPTFTGTVTIPSGASISGYLTTATAASTYAPLASPVFTGVPTASTAAAGTNNFQLATTAFVQTAASNPANPVSVGSSVYPSNSAPVTTTATSTSGSPTITVTSASGIGVYQGITGSFVPNSCSTANAAFVNPYVVSIVGTTVTMSCNATATNASPVSVQFGQTRNDANSLEMANSVSAKFLKVGSNTQGNTVGWLNQVSTGQDYSNTSTVQITPPLGAGYGLTVGALSSAATGGAPAFPIQSILYLDSWGNTAYGAENLYLQDNLAAATAGHAQPHIQMEQSVNSLWGTPPAEDPYTTNVVNQTINHRYDCGTGQQSAPFPNNCTSAVDIVNNGAKFENGIVIANNAIDTSGGTGNGISMPLNVAQLWYSAASTYSASITSKNAGYLDINTPSGGGLRVNGGLVIPSTAPTIASGFGTGPSIPWGTSPASFAVQVGTSPGSTGVLTMPAAPHAWICHGVDMAQNNTTQFYMRQTASSSTSVTIGMFSSTATASNFGASDFLEISCFPM